MTIAMTDEQFRQLTRDVEFNNHLVAQALASLANLQAQQATTAELVGTLLVKSGMPVADVNRQIAELLDEHSSAVLQSFRTKMACIQAELSEHPRPVLAAA